jgi:hypothetical protein
VRFYGSWFDVLDVSKKFSKINKALLKLQHITVADLDNTFFSVESDIMNKTGEALSLVKTKKQKPETKLPHTLIPPLPSPNFFRFLYLKSLEINGFLSKAVTNIEDKNNTPIEEHHGTIIEEIIEVPKKKEKREELDEDSLDSPKQTNIQLIEESNNSKKE